LDWKSEKPPGASGFEPGVRILEGVLQVDQACAPSALLHEAGHLAVVPERFRGLMSDDLASGMRRMFEELPNMNLDPDHPLERAAIQCCESEATAWAWAAGLRSELAPMDIIQDAVYNRSGAEIRAMLQAGQYVGINGLAHAGMCKARALGCGGIPLPHNGALAPSRLNVQEKCRYVWRDAVKPDTTRLAR